MVCEYYERETHSAVESGGFDDVNVLTFPADCDYTQKGSGKLIEAVNTCKNDCSQIHILGSSCLVGSGNTLRSLERCYFHNMDQCFSLFIGRNIVDDYLGKGAHLLTPGWLRHWRSHIEKDGFDEQTARMFFGESTTKLVLLDTGVDTQSQERLREFANFVNLHFEIIPAGLDFFRLFLSKIVLNWRWSNEKTSSTTALANARRQLADYAMIYDLFGDLTRTMTEAEAIDKILIVFTAIFAADSLIYISLVNGKPGIIQSRPKFLVHNDAVKSSLLGLREDYAWTESKDGFLLRIGFQDETVGIIRVAGFAFPAYTKHYLNLSLILARVCGLVISNSRTYQLLLNDIINRKRVEEELREQVYRAQKWESVGTLAGGIAHDFNNLLTGIIGYGCLIQMETKEDSLKHYAQKILKTAGKAATLTQGLLAFSKKQPSNPEPVSVNTIIKEAEYLFSRVTKEDIKRRTSLGKKDFIVMADSGQIEQVLMNLVTNARGAMPDGGELTISTDCASMDNEFVKAHGFGEIGEYVRITVSDTGIGMDEKTKERIFEPFFTTKEVGKGTGLGLAMVHGIVKQHAGYIDVYSEPGKGTTFNIYLPLIQSKVEKKKKETEKLMKGGAETILLAEDEENVRGIIKIVLERHGYQVIEAIDGADAVGEFRANKERIHLILLDVIMPNKNGRETYEAIIKMKPAVKAIFMSGYGSDAFQKKDILEKGIHFLPKPISPQELLEKVREILDT